MKRLFPVMIIMILSLNCERDQPIENIYGTWVVVSYEDYVNNSVIEKNDVDSWNGMDIILKFMSDSLCGRNTTNSVFAHYTLSDSTIHVISYGGTKMGQPEWGNMFSDVVYGLETYKINENRLSFYYNNNKNSVTLKPKKSPINLCHF